VLLLAVALACVSYAWRHWSNVRTVAHLVDERAQLTDRLATLVDLHLRPRASRLAPVLVAQTLALGARWQAQRIVPRRVARSAFLLLAALLAYGEHDSPRAPDATANCPGPATPGGQPARMTRRRLRSLYRAAVLRQPQQLDNRQDCKRMATTNRAGQCPRSGIRVADGTRQPRHDRWPVRSGTGGPAWLTDRLQQAITDAFHAEKLDTRAPRRGRDGSASAPDARPQADDDARRGSDTNAGRSSPAPARSTGEDKNRTASQSAQTATQRQGGANAPQNLKEIPRGPVKGRVHKD